MKFDFPKNNEEANKFQGFLEGKDLFIRVFEFENNITTTLSKVNLFLKEIGYDIIPKVLLDSEFNFEKGFVSISKHGYEEALVLMIKNDRTDLNLKTITKSLIDFRDERDWKQFHNSKDLAIAISLESSELLELFLWKENEDFDKVKLKEELADIVSYSLLLAEKHDLNIFEIVKEKIEINSKKYPVSKAKGTSKKYNEF